MRAIRLVTLALTISAAAFAAPADTHASYDGPCEAITSFVQSRQPSAGAVRPLQLGFACSLPTSAQGNFLIATVPNPIDTHLALWFDRAVESIVNAAGSVGFRFQEAWVPWDSYLVRDEQDPFKRKEIKAEHDYREKQPGVLLFRIGTACPAERCQYSDLIVLLVPETPTGGIEREVFSDASKMILRMNPGISKIPVSGPSFSGSFASLAKIMQASKEIGNRLDVISGTAETPGAWKAAFQNSPGQYNTTVHDRATVLQMLQDHFNNPNLALLTETETHLAEDKTVRTFVYPREISRLRNAYGDEVLKTVVGAQQQPASFRNLLGFRLYDVGFGTDSTPVLATNQTPLSQDAVLSEIARSLQRERIQMAGILATDVFDALFITRYLSDACPDVRIFTFDPDLLYVRAAEDFSLDGILALGTYPLIASNKTWTDLPSSHQQTPVTVFPSQRAEGIYNATRALLINNSFVSKDLKNEPLAEYSGPTASCNASASSRPIACTNPPIWLLAVTRTGYWPLAVKDIPDKAPLLTWPSKNDTRFSIGPLPRLWQLLFVLISVAIAGWYFVQYFSGVVRPRQEGWLTRLCYLQVCSLALVALYALFVAPLLAVSTAGLGPDEAWPVPAAWLLLCAFLILAAAPLAALRQAEPIGEPPLTTGAPDFPKWPECWNFAILGMAWLFVVAFIWALLRLFVLPLQPGSGEPDHEGFFFAFRSLHLSSGVSPVAPLLILLLAHFLWGWVHLKRVRLRQRRLIDAPSLAGDSVNKPGEAAALESSRDAIDKLVNEPLPWHWRTLVTFGIVLAINRYITHALRSFEYCPFDWVFLSLFSLLYALLFLTWTRFLIVWHRFRLFLEALERQPFRSAFSRLPKQTAVSPLLVSTPRRVEFTMFVAIRERLAKLKLEWDSNWLAIGNLDDEIGTILAKATCGCIVSRSCAQTLRKQLQVINGNLLTGLSGPAAESEATGKAEASNSPDQLREEVLALQYIDYIDYIIHQQRNLLLFSVSAFILSIVALHAYPFQAPRTIDTFITVVFISFAVGVVMVLVGAERDAILSRITKTEAGTLSGSFYVKVAGYVGVPLVTVLSSQFPSWGRFLFSWVQPLLESIK